MKVVSCRDADNGSQVASNRLELRRQPRGVRLRLSDTLRNARVPGGIKPIRHAGPDRVQLDVGHDSKDRAAIARGLTRVAAFPESPLAAVLAIRPSRDGFDQAAHEPRKATQTLAQDADSLRVDEQSLAFAFAGGVARFTWRKQSCPACRDCIVVILPLRADRCAVRDAGGCSRPHKRRPQRRRIPPRAGYGFQSTPVGVRRIARHSGGHEAHPTRSTRHCKLIATIRCHDHSQLAQPLRHPILTHLQQAQRIRRAMGFHMFAAGEHHAVA